MCYQSLAPPPPLGVGATSIPVTAPCFIYSKSPAEADNKGLGVGWSRCSRINCLSFRDASHVKAQEPPGSERSERQSHGATSTKAEGIPVEGSATSGRTAPLSPPQYKTKNEEAGGGLHQKFQISCVLPCEQALVPQGAGGGRGGPTRGTKASLQTKPLSYG